ncbi:hypothetical protein [Vreelandella lionensis]|uniref:hypothetical protein n=1 Tax=Vreelandella lionensis TaxID=1144478 RepID=UPI0009F54A3F|nr:hypothetical protein [Halomonas lionensis]
MEKSKPLVLKNGRLERVPSFPPAERVALLVDANDDVHLTPVSTPYLAMGFPIGVFTRAYEELHYLDSILYRAAADYYSKAFFESQTVRHAAEQMAAYEQTLRQAASLSLIGQSSADTLAKVGEVWAKQDQAAMAALNNTLSDYAKQISEEHSAQQALMANSLRHVTPTAETLANMPVSHFEPARRELPQVPPPSSASMQFLFEENGRARAEQAERDALHKRQTENSDEQLRILTAQVEEGKRSQAAQKWSNRKALWLAAAALFVSILTGFWEAEELRAMVVEFFEAPPE